MGFWCLRAGDVLRLLVAVRGAMAGEEKAFLPKRNFDWRGRSALRSQQGRGGKGDGVWLGWEGLSGFWISSDGFAWTVFRPSWRPEDNRASGDGLNRRNWAARKDFCSLAVDRLVTRAARGFALI
jgi:hypothetical protein